MATMDLDIIYHDMSDIASMEADGGRWKLSWRK